MNDQNKNGLLLIGTVYTKKKIEKNHNFIEHSKNDESNRSK